MNKFNSKTNIEDSHADSLLENRGNLLDSVNKVLKKLTLVKDKERSLFLANKLFAEIIYDVAYLEGSPYTFPEVQTLLEGITVGGHKLDDEKLIINQSNSWKLLLEMVKKNEFTISKEVVLKLHTKVAKEEALKWGSFRDGQVYIAGTEWMPPAHEALDAIFKSVTKDIETIANPYEKGICLFLYMARNQFFYDGNKRTGRLMMNGIILSAGYEAISIPAKRKQAFNEKMIRFYNSGDTIEMLEFILSCSRV